MNALTCHAHIWHTWNHHRLCSHASWSLRASSEPEVSLHGSVQTNIWALRTLNTLNREIITYASILTAPRTLTWPQKVVPSWTELHPLRYHFKPDQLYQRISGAKHVHFDVWKTYNLIQFKQYRSWWMQIKMFDSAVNYVKAWTSKMYT